MPENKEVKPKTQMLLNEVMVEGKNEARSQWIGRTSDNRTLNFTVADSNGHAIHYAAYVQDDWKATDRLTANIGARCARTSPPRAKSAAPRCAPSFG